MELAGLAVAQATYVSVMEARPSHPNAPSSPPPPRILVVCGPGNNGGDGLVAARHLTLFGCHVDIVYPKLPSSSSTGTSQPHYARLLEQCRDAGITEIRETLPFDDLSKYHAIVDAIFGFSFHGEPREPFKSILRDMKHAQEQYGIMMVSVDVPSGWHVNDGPVGLLHDEYALQPDVLISLTAPKPCAQYFVSQHSSSSSRRRRPVRHFVGGRFVPPALAKKYLLVLPTYPGMSQIVEVTPGATALSSTKDDDDHYDVDHYDWATDYAAYLAKQETSASAAAHHDNDDEAVAASSSPNEEHAVTTTTTTSWQEEYAAYCHAKETETETDRRQP